MSPEDKNQTDIVEIIEEKITKVNGDIAIKRYEKGKLLGKGGFAKCFEFKDLETSKIYAAKIIQKQSLQKSRQKQKLISEIKIHKSVHHRNIVQFEKVFEDQENVYIILEICRNQTLNDRHKREKQKIPPSQIIPYIHQIIQALKYLHSTRIIHRDLKLSNLFLSDKDEIKIGDFGLATKLEFEGEKKRTVCGTPNYIAPEILDGKMGHSYEVDIWSLGVIIYTLLIGKPPFETPDVKTTYKRIKMNQYIFPENSSVSDHARDIISKILVPQPSDRPTLSDIEQHPFISSQIQIPRQNQHQQQQYQQGQSFFDSRLSVNTSPHNQRLGSSNHYGIYGQNEFINSAAKEGGIPDINMRGSVGGQPRAGSGFAQTQRANELKLKQLQPQASLLQFNISPMNNLNKKLNREDSNPNFQGLNFNNQQYTSQKYLEQVQQQQAQLTTQLNSKYQFNVHQHNGISSFLQKDLASSANQYQKQALQVQMAESKAAVQEHQEEKEIFVVSWVDYTLKYGVGYQLSNGFYGVYFNDNTKMLVDGNQVSLHYLEKQENSKEDNLKTYKYSQYPEDLSKKVVLLQHFKSYLENQQKQSIVNNSKNLINISSEFVYIKKMMKTKHAFLFRLSNKLVQVCFNDNTQILLSSVKKHLLYVNKKNERLEYEITKALENENTEMVKRFKYTKEILTSFQQPKQDDIQQKE